MFLVFSFSQEEKLNRGSYKKLQLAKSSHTNSRSKRIFETKDKSITFALQYFLLQFVHSVIIYCSTKEAKGKKKKESSREHTEKAVHTERNRERRKEKKNPYLLKFNDKSNFSRILRVYIKVGNKLSPIFSQCFFSY